MNREEFEQAFQSLTPRRREVLELLLTGKEDREIAESLYIAESSVRQHIRNICIHFGLTNDVDSDRTSQRFNLVALCAIHKPELLCKEVFPEPITNPNTSPSKILRPRLCHLPGHNLPPQHNEFIGREEQLSELMRFFSEDHPAHIIQVDGIAGVGKTALVVEAAYRCLEYKVYQNGDLNLEKTNLQCKIPIFDFIIFVSAKETHLLPNSDYVRRLTVTRTLQQIYRTIADVIDKSNSIFIDTGISSNENEKTLKIIELLKSNNRVLLIVDNLETIEDKNKVLSFLYELPIKSVITTRNQAGFKSIQLASLNEEESKLLVEQQINLTGLNLNKEEKRKIREITRGIPMVIIWTIGRLARGRSLETIEEELQNPDGDVAQFSFKNSVNEIRHTLAYKLLLTISIFKKAPSRESVVATAGLEAEPEGIVRRELEKLQELSLIQYHNGRYRMLHLTREYALAELQKDVKFKNSAMERWVQWYINFAKKEHNQPILERIKFGYKSLEKEWENLVGVLHFCKDENRYQDLKYLWFDLNDYTDLRGHWKDRSYWLSYLTKIAIVNNDHKTAIYTMSRQGRTLLLMGHKEQLQEAEDLLLKAWSWREFANFPDVDYLLNHLAGLHIRLENYPEAHKWLDIEQDKLNEQGDLDIQEKLMYQIYIDRERAELYFHEKRYEESKTLCELTISNAENLENGRGLRNINDAKRILADIAIETNDLEAAEALLQAVYTEVEAHEDKRRIAYCLVSKAKLEQTKGNISFAKDYLSQALNHFNNLGMVRDFEKAKALRSSWKK